MVLFSTCKFFKRNSMFSMVSNCILLNKILKAKQNLANTPFRQMFEQQKNLSTQGIAVMYQLYLYRGSVTVHIFSRALFNLTSIQQSSMEWHTTTSFLSYYVAMKSFYDTKYVKQFALQNQIKKLIIRVESFYRLQLCVDS